MCLSSFLAEILSYVFDGKVESIDRRRVENVGCGQWRESSLDLGTGEKTSCCGQTREFWNGLDDRNRM